MKTFSRALKRQDGFTLVELMVVVAIIGLLSAVAVPNFKKYQAKAKMSEAKLQLSSLYTAQTAFFSDYNIYHNCIAYMGFNPHREVLNRYYAVGITVPAAINGTGGATPTGAYGAAVTAGLDEVTCGRTNAAATVAGVDPNTVVPANTTWFRAGKGVGSTMADAATFIPTTLIGDQANTNNMTFTAGAGGVIDSDHVLATTGSQLTVNQAKLIRTVRNGF